VKEHSDKTVRSSGTIVHLNELAEPSDARGLRMDETMERPGKTREQSGETRERPGETREQLGETRAREQPGKTRAREQPGETRERPSETWERPNETRERLGQVVERPGGMTRLTLRLYLQVNEMAERPNEIGPWMDEGRSRCLGSTAEWEGVQNVQAGTRE
jgi:hypothetical protein